MSVFDLEDSKAAVDDEPKGMQQGLAAVVEALIEVVGLVTGRGVTLIEIMLMVSLGLIIASFALPSMSNATARADMRVASEKMQYSIRIARSTEIMTESKVTMNIEEQGEGGQRITFSVSRPDLKASDQPELQADRLPEDILLMSDQMSYEFDGRGIVQNPGLITLVSSKDESLITRLKIE